MGNDQTNDAKPGWLKRIQEQSWEPELLISGLVLFALFQVPDIVDQLWRHLEINASAFLARSGAADAIPVLLKVSVYFLIVGFITHIFLRSIWVAYAGLSYLFKDGINFSNLRLPDMYARHLSKVTYEERIKKLEKICSGMFSLSFLFFMIILGLINVGLIILLCVYLTVTLFPGFSYFGIFSILYLLLGLLFLFDLLTLGVLRRIPYLSTLYYPIYRASRLLMLAPMYEDIYYGFLSNNKKWKADIIMVLFFFVFFIAHLEVGNPGSFTTSLALQVTNSDSEILYSGHYEDRATEDVIGLALIPSDIIRENVLRVFVLHRISHEPEEVISECRDEQDASDTTEDRFKLNCLNDIYRVSVNDSVFTTDGSFQKNRKFGINGIVYWLDISHLPRGEHKLETYRKVVQPDTSYYIQQAIIEFFKEAPQL